MIDETNTQGGYDLLDDSPFFVLVIADICARAVPPVADKIDDTIKHVTIFG